MQRLALLLVLAAACSGSGTGVGVSDSMPAAADAGPRGDDRATAGDAGEPITDAKAAADAALPTRFGGDRPATLRVPAGYDPSRPAPLVLNLHGYSDTSAGQQAYFRLDTIADAEGFFLIAPDGTVDSLGNQFWNATDACCN